MESVEFEPNAYKNYVYNFIVNNKDAFDKSYYIQYVPRTFFPNTFNRTLSLTSILKFWRIEVNPSFVCRTNKFKDFILACIMEQFWDGRVFEIEY